MQDHQALRARQMVRDETMTTTPSDRRQLLFLLDRDEVAWAMIATWPNVSRERLPQDAAQRKAALVRRWATLAGYRDVEIARAYDKLFDNGFIDEDGNVDPMADKYVAAMVFSKLPPSVRPKPRKPENPPAEEF